MPRIITIEKKAILLQCHRCKHSWPYTGLNNYIASCPHCGTKVSIKKQLSQISGIGAPDSVITKFKNRSESDLEYG